jgi:hypothetical protein
MKFILKTADFSANNIGQTTVPLITSPTSQAYFDAIPTSFAAMSDAHKLAFNSAINSLVSNGIYTQAAHLYIHLPVLDSTERWINIAAPAQTLAYPSSGYATFDANGANPIQGWATGTAVVSESRHAIFNNTTTTTATRNNVTVGSTGYSGWVGRRIATGNSGYLYDSGNKAQFTGRTSSSGSLIGVNDRVNSTMFALDSTANGVLSVQLGSASTNDVVLFGTVEGSTTSTPEQAIGATGWGGSLTYTQSQSYVAILDTLVTALMA